MTRKSGNLRWLRPDGETQVTIEYVPQDLAEIVEVVRLIPQERFHQRTVEQIVHVTEPQIVEERTEVVQIIPKSASRRASLNRRCASCEAAPSIAQRDGTKDCPCLSGRRACCDAGPAALPQFIDEVVTTLC